MEYETNCQSKPEQSEGMMNRIGWFIHLRTAFENSKKDLGVNDLVLKSDFLSKLQEAQQVSITK